MTARASPFPYGIEPVARGLARVPAGAELLRAHPYPYGPEWFGPAVGARGTNRFDIVGPRTSAQRGVCYLAFTMISVLHEAVLRGTVRRYIDRDAQSRLFQASSARCQRDLLLVDLCLNLPANGVTMSDITAAPSIKATPPYPTTQPMATTWEEESRLGRWVEPPGATVDGILYSSRFGALNVCVALWESRPVPLDWVSTVPLGTHPEFDRAAESLGMTVGP